MAALTVTVHPAELVAALASPGGPPAHDLERRGERVAATARRLAPRRTGRLAASISAGPARRHGRGLRVLIEASAPYALYVHQGVNGRPGRPFLVRALPAAAG